ncbi:MAG: hypothetical protein WC785_08505 [Tatlockia sp.]|jgi:hypothetical protein
MLNTPTHVNVSEKKYCFFRTLKPVLIPEEEGARNALLHGQLKNTKAKLKGDVASYKGKYLFVSCAVVVLIALVLISQIYADSKKTKHQDNSVNYGTDIGSLLIAVGGGILTYFFKSQNATAEQHLKETKDSRKTIKQMAVP